MPIESTGKVIGHMLADWICSVETVFDRSAEVTTTAECMMGLDLARTAQSPRGHITPLVSSTRSHTFPREFLSKQRARPFERELD
ncbi:hypothetical protein BaRGS_00008857 [Batillaria attramentaria]|uniref:Uncharacterized protein n=1 Tax=Batillaria attramentaria TaxID=370345 RepID=A0ABD0LKG0_9CAEN